MSAHPLPSPIYQARALQGVAPDGRLLFSLSELVLVPGVTVLLGDEGSGKTTLLKLLAGSQPQYVNEATLAGSKLHTQVEAYRRNVAWLDPASAVWEQTVVNDIWAQIASDYPHWSQETLEDLCAALDLQVHRSQPLSMLSAGSRRKALMMAAFASGAALTLLDMPFAALDAVACRTLREVLADCSEHPHRAFVVADYTAPAGVDANLVLNLDTLPTH